MADWCPHCDLATVLKTPTCPACGKPTAAATAVTSTPSPVEQGIAAGLPPAPPLTETPSIADPAATGPACPPLLLILLSTILCAAQGASFRMGEPGRLMAVNSKETVIAGVIGLLIGIVLACDHWFFQRKLEALTAIADDDPDAPLRLPPVSERPREWVAVLMLLIPVLAGGASWFGKSLGLTNLHQAFIGSAAIVLTSILGYVSIRQVALRVDRGASYRGVLGSPAFIYLGMLGFWIICYPLHFVGRARLGGRNLLAPGLGAMGIYFLPLVLPFFMPVALPDVDDPEVLALIQDLLKKEPMLGPVTLKQPIEISFDEERQQRLGRCTLTSRHGDEPVTYLIDWQDHAVDVWQVRLLDRLPSVDAPEVIEVLKNVIRDDQLRRALLLQKGRLPLDLTVRNPTQVSYDPVRQERVGRAFHNSPAGDQAVVYIVRWHDAERTQFVVTLQDPPP